MNEKIKAILLKIVIALKKKGWILDKDYELNLQSEGNVPLKKGIDVEGSMENKEWSDKVDTWLYLSLESDDQITFYPEFTIGAEIFIQGGDIKDVNYKMDADVGFTEEDFKDDAKAELAAKRVDYYTETHVEGAYQDYIDRNAEDIKNYRRSDWKADIEPDDNL